MQLQNKFPSRWKILKLTQELAAIQVAEKLIEALRLFVKKNPTTNLGLTQFTVFWELAKIFNNSIQRAPTILQIPQPPPITLIRKDIEIDCKQTSNIILFGKEDLKKQQNFYWQPITTILETRLSISFLQTLATQYNTMHQSLLTIVLSNCLIIKSNPGS